MPTSSSDPIEAILVVECPRCKRPAGRPCYEWEPHHGGHPAFCASRIRLALSPEAPKLALTEAEIEAARKRAAERIEKFGWAPKPAEAATCEPWCGTDAGATGDTVPYYCSANGKAWGNWDCRRAGRCLHPATEQAATCGACDGWGRVDHMAPKSPKCPGCGGTGRR